MSTQSIAGYNGTLYVSTDGGTTWIAVGELQDVKLKISTKMLDATSHSSQGFAEYVPGNQDWTATAAVLAVFADAGQVAISAALTPKTKLKFKFNPAGDGTGKPTRSGSGYIQDWEEQQPNANLEIANLTIQGTGPLTIGELQGGQ